MEGSLECGLRTDIARDLPRKNLQKTGVFGKSMRIRKGLWRQRHREAAIRKRKEDLRKGQSFLA
jgi:hypothetical protein